MWEKRPEKTASAWWNWKKNRIRNDNAHWSTPTNLNFDENCAVFASLCLAVILPTVYMESHWYGIQPLKHWSESECEEWQSWAFFDKINNFWWKWKSEIEGRVVSVWTIKMVETTIESLIWSTLNDKWPTDPSITNEINRLSHSEFNKSVISVLTVFA